MKCKNCGQPIRWVESMGWVHGGLGEGYNQLCYVGATTEAEARPEDL